MIIDSQSVKTTEQGGAVVGFDSHKRTKGRKRFIEVDTLGLLVSALVVSAAVDERSGGQELLSQSHDYGHERIEVVYADAGFDGPKLAAAVAAETGWRLECSPRRKAKAAAGAEYEFVVQKWRWIVERTLSWLSRCRRLSKDYEVLVESSVAMMQLAMSRLMLRRLGDNRTHWQ